MFEYIWQPPSTTLNCCNPYYIGFITIVLECIVRYQTDEFEIRWFRENTTGAVEDLGLGDPDRSQGNMLWFSRYHDSDFFNQQYNSSYLGKYWCQVINTTADPDQPLMRSNVFTLLAPENYMYTQPTCVNQSTTIQTMENITCADLPVHSEQTTLPAPTTTLPAPTTTLPAPTTTLPAPTTTLPAPTTTLPAPTTTLPAPITTLPAPITTCVNFDKTNYFITSHSVATSTEQTSSEAVFSSTNYTPGNHASYSHYTCILQYFLSS